MRPIVNGDRSRYWRAAENPLDAGNSNSAWGNINIAFKRHDAIPSRNPQSRKQCLRAPREQPSSPMAAQSVRPKRHIAPILRVRPENVGLDVGKEPRLERTGGGHRE